MFNPFTVNQDYKVLQKMYMDLLQKKEKATRLVGIFKFHYYGAEEECNQLKRVIGMMAQTIDDQEQELESWDDTYEQELLHQGRLVNEINKLEEVVTNQKQIITSQAELLLLYKKKLSKGGKAK